MRLTGAEIIIEVLKEQGVDTVFGYPGGSVLNIYDELYKHRNEVKHYITCHEQGAAHAADGYARATGKPGVVIATSGPGATNLVTGIAGAYADSTPVVAITGNVAVELLGRDSFQEVDITGVTMPITKHNYIVKDVESLAQDLRKAFRVAISGRPGPVLVDVPKDVQIASAEYTPKPAQYKRIEPEVAYEELEEALLMIRESKRPYIYSGGGTVIADASRELERFAELVDAPVGTSMMGLTGLSSDNPRFLGMMGMHGRHASTSALTESDLVIAVGVRFSDRATGDKEKFSQGKKVLHIDIDPAEINKNISANRSVQGNIKVVLSALNKMLEPQDHKEWMTKVAEMKACTKNCVDMGDGRLTPQYVIEGVNVHMKPEDVVATDVGQHQMWTTLYYRFRAPRTFLTSGGLGAMGFGLGAAIGASIARDKGRTVLITSDGSFHMNMNELATAVTNELPLIVIVLNNNALGMVRQWQALFFDERYSNTTPNRKTNFSMLATSFGASGFKVSTREEFDEAVEKAFELSGPVVIDCVIDSDERVYPFIPPNKGISDIILR